MTKPVSEETIDAYNQNSSSWADAVKLLEENPAGPGRSYWLSTTNPDGSPHTTGIGALWVDDRFYFVSGDGTRKSKNVALNPHVVISAGLPGLDLTVEGVASRVTDEATLQHVAEAYAAVGWGPTVQDGAFVHDYSAPTAGPPPWQVYEVAATKAIGLGGSEEGAATRWRF
jgi:pyridoxamine 5'-phosphate oxidase-like protein